MIIESILALDIRYRQQRSQLQQRSRFVSMTFHIWVWFGEDLCKCIAVEKTDTILKVKEKLAASGDDWPQANEQRLQPRHQQETKVIEFNDRYQNPMPGGYRDLQILVKVNGRASCSSIQMLCARQKRRAATGHTMSHGNWSRSLSRAVGSVARRL